MMTNKKKPPQLCRQGDILFIPLTGAEPEVAPAPKDPRGLVLAEGETSGHHHAIFGRGAKLFNFKDTSGQRLIVVGKGGAEVRVVGGESAPGMPRHTPVQLVPGKWICRTQRAWTSAQRSRAVAD